MASDIPPSSDSRLSRAARIVFVVAAMFAFVMAALPHPPPIPGRPPDKLVHILAFATLGTLAAAGFPRQSIIRLFLVLAGFGAAIELVQAIPILNRDSEWADLLADMAAALVALLGTRWLLAWRPKARSTEPV